MAVPVAELFVTIGSDVSGAVAGLTRLQSTLQSTAANLNKMGSELTRGLTVPIAAGGAAVAGFGIGFEHAFTAVRKTVDDTTTNLDELKKGIIDLSTTEAGGGKSAEELASVAAIAGSMGIQGADGILKFTRVVAGMAVATGLTEEEIAKSMGAIATVTGTPAEEFENLGSAITRLGNDTAATEHEIFEMANRLSGTLSALGVSTQDILGISAAMAELKINPEEGGTAISKFFVEMTEAASGSTKQIKETSQAFRDLSDRLLDLQGSLDVALERQKEFGRNTPKSVVKANELAIAKYRREIADAHTDLGKLSAKQETATTSLDAFAKVAGVSTDEFRALVKTDPSKAFTAIIQGLHNLGAEDPAAQLAALRDLGIDDSRQRAALLKLASAPDLLTDRIRIANDAWAENKALQEEVRKSMQDTTNQFNLLVNQLKAEFIPIWENDLKPMFLDLVSVVRDQIIPEIHNLVGMFHDLDDPSTKFFVGTLAFLAALGPALVVLGTMATLIAAISLPIVGLLALIGILAIAWATNFGDIQGKTKVVSNAIAEAFHDLNVKVSLVFANIIQLLVDFFAAIGSKLPGDQGKFFLEWADGLSKFRQQLLATAAAEDKARQTLALARAPADTQAAVAASAAGEAFPGIDLGPRTPVPPEVAMSAAGMKFPELGPEFNAPVVQFTGPVNVESEEARQDFANKTATAVIDALIASEQVSTIPAGSPLPGAPFGAMQPTPI